jgi:hypothetical protein
MNAIAGETAQKWMPCHVPSAVLVRLHSTPYELGSR